MKLPKLLSGPAVLLLSSALLSSAASYEWTFASGDLSSSLGNGTLTYRDAATPGVTTFRITDGVTVPHIGGEPARFMHVPVLDPANGYWLTLTDTGPNGGGSYVNQYSIVFDLYSPGGADWQALFNTDPNNSNDADFYISPSGELGIGAVGYSASGTIAQDTWYRIAFTADLTAGTINYFVDGAPVFSATGLTLLDGRFGLYSNADDGPDVLLFNEGDGSGNYTHELYVSSVFVTDQTLTPEQVSALGGPNAGGVVVPEPSSWLLTGLGGALLLGWRLRRR